MLYWMFLCSMGGGKRALGVLSVHGIGAGVLRSTNCRTVLMKSPGIVILLSLRPNIFGSLSDSHMVTVSAVCIVVCFLLT